MTELLKRWAELEPERCRPKPVGDPAPGPHIVAAGTWWSAGAFPDITPALVLVAVIEGIEARGWWWKLHRYGTWPHLVRGHVGPDPLSAVPRLGEGPTPAAALLTAYLAALADCERSDT